MCPVCLMAAALVAGKATGLGGLAAVAAKKLHNGIGADQKTARIAATQIKMKEDHHVQHRDID